MLAPSRSTLLLALLPAPALGQATLFDLDPTSTGSRYSAGIDLVDDIDGDGIDDIVVSDDATGDGKVFVHSGADGTVLRTWLPSLNAQAYGRSVAGVGDVDGDGFGDVAIGDPNAAGSRGRLEIRSGATGAVLLTMQGSGGSDWLGESVAAIGDLDGDGVTDLAVGAPGDDLTHNDNVGSVSFVSGATGAVLRVVYGSGTIPRMGWRVDGAGDVDGDGVPDVIIASLHVNSGGSNAAGEAHLVSGATGQVLHHFAASTQFEWFAHDVAGIGDVDGDGVGDVAIGVMHERTIGWRGGSVIVYSGATGAQLYEAFPETGVARFGASVDGGGDVNGDGVPDIVVGAPGEWGLIPAYGEQYSTGVTYVLSGDDGRRLFAFDGDGISHRFGSDALLAGDLDGDGFDDVIGGADQWVAGQPGDGYARVFRGGPTDAYGIATTCVATLNSTGGATTLAARGTTSVTQDHLLLEVTGGPPLAPTIVVVGSASASTPFGAGSLCVGGQAVRLSLLRMPTTGAFSHWVALEGTMLGTLLVPGSTWHFQVLFRDGGASQGANTSDALSVLFVP
ncbi:MAG: integrin alpha [Planctomycetota bacterium]